MAISLDSALSSALSSVKANQQVIGVISNNIANVNNPNYSRRVANLESLSSDGNIVGVAVASVTRNVDENLISNARIQQSEVSSASIIDTYYQDIQALFGDPGSSNSILNNIDDVFTSLGSLENRPELASLKLDVVNKASQMASNMNALAKNLHQLRYNADQQIAQSVNNINSLLGKLSSNNMATYAAFNLGSDTTNLIENRDLLLSSLAQELDINVFFAQNGTAQVSAAGGKSLLGLDQYIMNYNQSGSLDAVTQYQSFNALTVTRLNSDGSMSNLVTDFISSGVSEISGTPSTIVNNIVAGNLYALQQLRDVQIPQIIDELDNISNVITQQFNAIHNSGGGFPPVGTLTGTRPITSADGRDFSGQARIAILDQKGNPVLRPDSTALPPLTLDFTKIASAAVEGEMTSQTIVNEINQYFYNNYVENRASISNLYDVRLASSSNFSTIPGGVMSFDLELENISQLASRVEITSVTVSGGCVGLTSALPNSTDIAAGVRARTGADFTVDFSGGTGGPYDVTVNISVTDGNGSIQSGVITYLVNDNPSTALVQNTRYQPIYAGGEASFNVATAVNGVARAVIVDASGNPVKPGNPGYLQIVTNNSNYGIVIDDATSQDMGLQAGSPYSVGAISATGKGFSAFFELNDFFVRNDNTQSGTSNASITGTAINLKVRTDIVADQSLMSVGKLSRSPGVPESSVQGVSVAKATVSFESNPSIGDMITIGGTSFTFVASASTDSEVTIGATLDNTLSNLASALNATNLYNAGSVNKATYASDTMNLYVTFASAGTEGNSFNIAGNFQATQISIDNGAYSSTATGLLMGGSEQFVTTNIIPWTYQIAIGSKESVIAFSSLRNQSINFNRSGYLPPMSNNIYGYFGAIVSYNTIQSANATSELSDQNSVFSSYTDKIYSVGGVNLDQEMGDTLKYMNAYKASSKMMTLVISLYDVLFATFK